MNMRVSVLKNALCSFTLTNPWVPDGHGRLLENWDAVGSWCCAARFSVCEGRCWNFAKLLQTKQVKQFDERS